MSCTAKTTCAGLDIWCWVQGVTWCCHLTHTKLVPLLKLCNPLTLNINFVHRARKVMQIGTWNVQSMVDTEGPIEVASQRTDSQRGEDRKVDQMCVNWQGMMLQWGNCKGQIGLVMRSMKRMGVWFWLQVEQLLPRENPLREMRVWH